MYFVSAKQCRCLYVLLAPATHVLQQSQAVAMSYTKKAPDVHMEPKPG